MNDLKVSISLDLCELLGLKGCVESRIEFMRKLNYSSALIDKEVALCDKVQTAIDEWWRKADT